jgi:hypothetical protein
VCGRWLGVEGMGRRGRGGRRRTETVGVAVAGLGALLACSAAGCAGGDAAAGDPARTDPLTAVRQAAAVLEQAGSSRTRTAIRMASGGTRVTLRGTGGFDFASRTGRLRVMPPREASGAQTAGPITELVTPGALYMKDRGGGVPPDKWVRVDATTLPDGNLVTGGATDPYSAALLLGGARSAADAGRRELEGTPVRHIRGRLDLRAAARAAPAHARGRLTAAAKGFSHRTVTFDAYLDASGRLRQVRHLFTFAEGVPGGAAAGSGAGGSGATAEVRVVSVTSLHDFGAPVRVTMPEAGDIWTGRIARP